MWLYGPLKTLVVSTVSYVTVNDIYSRCFCIFHIVGLTVLVILYAGVGDLNSGLLHVQSWAYLSTLFHLV